MSLNNLGQLAKTTLERIVDSVSYAVPDIHLSMCKCKLCLNPNEYQLHHIVITVADAQIPGMDAMSHLLRNGKICLIPERYNPETFELELTALVNCIVFGKSDKTQVQLILDGFDINTSIIMFRCIPEDIAKYPELINFLSI